MDNQLILFPLIAVIGYLLGSIPSAYLIGRLNRIDIFAIGSGNMGATNVHRVIGWRWGLVVWMLDSLKGIAAILIARELMGDSKAAATTVAAVAGVIGHNWSLFASIITGRIRGGKGAAVGFGTLLMIVPLYVIVGVFVLGGFVVAGTRYVSLSVIVMGVASALWIMVLVAQHQLPPEYRFYALAVLVLVIVRHKANIERLLTGTERRLGERA